MVDRVQAKNLFVQEFFQKPEVQFGFKITAIALAAIALTIAISVPAAYFLPVAPLAAILTLRISVLFIWFGSIGLIDLAYKECMRQKEIASKLS